MSKKARVVCACGTKMKAKAATCPNPKCGRPNPAAVRKAVPAALRKSITAYVTKAAGSVACVNGHLNRPGGKVCTECTELMPGVLVPPLADVNKSAFAASYWRPLAASPDPDARELFTRLLNGGQS